MTSKSLINNQSETIKRLHEGLEQSNNYIRNVNKVMEEQALLTICLLHMINKEGKVLIKRELINTYKDKPSSVEVASEDKGVILTYLTEKDLLDKKAEKKIEEAKKLKKS